MTRVRPGTAVAPPLARRIVLAAAILASSSCVTPAPGSRPVTAQRSTLSSDTATVPRGAFELELGGTYARDETTAVPTSVKYGAGRSTELFLEWNAFLEREVPGPDVRGVGDLGVGIRHRFLEETDTGPSAAVQTIVKFPVASEDEGLGTGKLDVLLSGMVTKTVHAVTWTGYYGFDAIGQSDGGTGTAHNFAIAAVPPLFGRFGAFGEVAGVVFPESDVELAYTTLALTYNPWRTLVLDVGAAIGLSDDTPDVQLLFGLTTGLGTPARGG